MSNEMIIRNAKDSLIYMCNRSYKTGGWKDMSTEELLHEESVLNIFQESREVLVDNKVRGFVSTQMMSMIHGLQSSLFGIDNELKERGVREKTEIDDYLDELFK